VPRIGHPYNRDAPYKFPFLAGNDRFGPTFFEKVLEAYRSNIK
jgi:hypothetical protein